MLIINDLTINHSLGKFDRRVSRRDTELAQLYAIP
jgi:hypothetical protein